MPDMTPGEWALWAMAVPSVLLALTHAAALLLSVVPRRRAICGDCPFAGCPDAD